MLVFSCIAVAIVCIAVIARRAIVNSQTNLQLIMDKDNKSDINPS